VGVPGGGGGGEKDHPQGIVLHQGLQF
jgi:hypothetical protein